MQGQLGLNKKHPVISIETGDNDQNLKVYIGFKFYTIVPNNSKSLRYRLLVAELAAAGFSPTALMKIFGFSRPTIMKYQAIIKNTPDETEMFDRIRGFNAQKTKLLPAVETFIVDRFPGIYLTNRATYNQQLRHEIYQKFKIVLSPEALRAVIAPLRKELAEKLEISSPLPTTATAEMVNTLTEEILLEESLVPAEIQVETIREEPPEQPVVAEKAIPKVYPQLYAGVLVLNVWLAEFSAGLGKLSPTFLQWMYQIFLTAVNFEQARYLSRPQLGDLIGETAISVSKSRATLTNLARNQFGATVTMLFQANLDCIQKYWANRPHYFYIDGHFDPYYGQIKILKGWCCRLNRTMKGTNHYAIHDLNGYPVVKELKDCFGDFRDFLKDALAQIKPIVAGRPVGIVFDRGGFSHALLGEFQTQGHYFITWEKHFDREREPALKFDSAVVIEREINEVGHFKSLEFNCAETTFQTSEKSSCRKIVFRTPKKDRDGANADFCASILTNDPALNHQQIIEFMTNRWRCQENDFKYEKKHFGLDQITSYNATPPVSIQQVIDQQQASLEALIQARTDLQAQKETLYTQLGVKRLTKNYIQTIETERREQPQSYESMVALRRLQPELKALTSQIEHQRKKLKRLLKIETKGYVRLDYRSKQILDNLRFSCRNIFYRAVNEFKSFYPNLRDYHEVFRRLIQASGQIEFSKEQVLVALYCPFFSGRVLAAVTNFVENLNQLHPVMLDGSNRKIIFSVKSKVAN